MYTYYKNVFRLNQVEFVNYSSHKEDLNYCNYNGAGFLQLEPTALVTWISKIWMQHIRFIIIPAQNTGDCLGQGEMVSAKFGIPAVAQRQMELYTTAVLLATVSPPKPPREEAWRGIMEQLSELSCKVYRSVRALLGKKNNMEVSDSSGNYL